MSDFFSSLLLLIIGAVLTGLLVPYIAGRWQRQQKALETKSEVILDITELITEMMLEPIMRIGADAPEAIQHPDKAVAATMPDWLRREAIIKARLSLYFPRSPIPKNWENLYVAVFNYVTFGTYDSREDKMENLDNIAEYLGERGKDVNWGLLAENRDELEIDSLKDQYLESSNQLRTALAAEVDAVIGLMLRTRIYGEFSISDYFK